MRNSVVELIHFIMTPVISSQDLLLTASQTIEFVKDIDEACKLADLNKLKAVLSKHNLSDKDAEDIVILNGMLLTKTKLISKFQC